MSSGKQGKQSHGAELFAERKQRVHSSFLSKLDLLKENRTSCSRLARTEKRVTATGLFCTSGTTEMRLSGVYCMALMYGAVFELSPNLCFVSTQRSLHRKGICIKMATHESKNEALASTFPTYRLNWKGTANSPISPPIFVTPPLSACIVGTVALQHTR